MHLQPPSAANFKNFVADSKTSLIMAETAATLLASLTPEQRSKVLFSIDAEVRLKWDYRPGSRVGMPLKELDSSQQKLVLALLASGLSRLAYTKALTVMSLEKILGELEGPGGRHIRDPDLYYVTLFGTPTDENVWAWRIEGHHLSVNFLILEGKWIAPTPNFLGANPARVHQGPMTGLRILAAEEELARRFMGSLNVAQKKQALINAEAPEDIVTRWDPRVNIDSPIGLPISEMHVDQEKSMMELVSQYTSRMPTDVAETQMDQIEKDGRKFIHFAWAGSEEPGQPHYYRLHGPTFLVEYDNTQNNANHIHTVWRSIGNDWGDDLLKGHYSRSH